MRRLRSAGTIRSNLTKILIGAMVPMAFLGVWQGTLTYEDSRNLVAERLRANAWAIAERERDPFIIARHSLQMLAQLDAIKQGGLGCDQLLGDAREGATGIVNFLRADRTGAVRCSGLPFTAGQSIAANRWWQKAQFADSFLLGGPVIGEVSKKPVLLLYLPLKDNLGRFDGTISAGIGLERLSHVLAARQRERGGVVMLIDRAGKVLLSSGPSRFLSLRRADEALLTPQMATSADDKQWTYVAAPMFDRELLVAYAEPRASFANAALARIWLILALPLLATALSLAGVWFATQRYLLGWFPRLHGLTQRIAEEQPINDQAEFASAPAEIAGIAEHLHSMAGTLSFNRTALQTALDTQKSLTRELNHRVRNNIQIIVSLLTMQADRVPQGWMRHLFDQARARVSAIGLVHRFAYDQDNGRMGRVAVSQLLHDLCSQIRMASRNSPDLALKVDADAGCKLSFDRAVPLMVFALEAISDAADRGGRKIGVRLKSQVHGCRLEIEDDGAAPGGLSDGAELMSALAEQISGRFGFKPKTGESCTWLEFPGE